MEVEVSLSNPKVNVKGLEFSFLKHSPATEFVPERKIKTIRLSRIILIRMNLTGGTNLIESDWWLAQALPILPIEVLLRLRE